MYNFSLCSDFVYAITHPIVCLASFVGVFFWQLAFISLISSPFVCLSLSVAQFQHFTQETLRFLGSVVEAVKEACSTAVIKKAIRNQFKLMQL